MASSEVYLISSVLKNKDYAQAIGEGITTKMFNGYETEWAWIEKYVSKHKKVPGKAAFRNQFPDFRLKDVDDDTAHFCEAVKKDYTKRALTQSIHETTDKMADGDLEGAVALMSSSIVSIGAVTGALDDRDAVANFEDILKDVQRRVERAKTEGSSGIKTGFRMFDKITGGLQPGTLTIVGARLGEGKSYCMQNMSVTNLLNKKVVQFNALEQSSAEVKMRMHSLISARINKVDVISASDLLLGEVDMAKYKSMLKKAKRQLAGSAFHVADSSRGQISIMTIASQIERNKPDVVYVDYLTLMKKGGNEWQDIGELTRGLKNLAQRYEIAIVAAAQLNREAAHGREPAGAETLAQSDTIGQDADYIITIRKQSPTTLAMKLAKNRNGIGGQKWYCHFNPGEGIFKTISFEKMLEIQGEEKDAEERANEAEDE